MVEKTPTGYPPKIKVDFSDLKKVFNQLAEFVKRDDNRWRLTITCELNCYILEGMVDGIHKKWAIEEDEKDPLKMHERLLWELREFFCFGGNKHSPERIRTVRVKRDDD